MQEEMDEVLERADIRPDIAYAIRKTGLIVTAHNKSLLTGRDLEEWNDAIEEYRTKSREKTTTQEKKIAQVIKLIIQEFHRCMVVMGLLLKEGGPLRVSDKRGLAAGHSLFCLTKALKSMRALAVLTDKKFGEDGFVIVQCLRHTFTLPIFNNIQRRPRI